MISKVVLDLRILIFAEQKRNCQKPANVADHCGSTRSATDPHHDVVSNGFRYPNVRKCGVESNELIVESAV